MIKKDVPVSAEEQAKGRNEWPFKDMEVGDVIDVHLEDEWHEASKYAHTLATKKRWKFSTRWLEKEGVGRIRRLK